MTNDGSYVYERQLGVYDDGGTGSDMRRFVVMNHETKEHERYHTPEAAGDRARELNKDRRPR